MNECTHEIVAVVLETAISRILFVSVLNPLRIGVAQLTVCPVL